GRDEKSMRDACSLKAENGLEHERRVHGGINCRMSTHEEKLQPFIGKLHRQGGLLEGISEQLEGGLACHRYLLMAYKVDEEVPDRRQEASFGILRHAVSWPGLERGH